MPARKPAKTASQFPGAMPLPGAFLFAPAGGKLWMDMIQDGAQSVAGQVEVAMTAQSALLTCKTPMEALAVHTEYASAALARAQDDMTRLVGHLTSGMQGTASELQNGHTRRYDDIPV